MAIYTIHGGHAKHGNKFCGAVGYCSESLVDRQIVAATKKWLEYAGHQVYDCSVDSGISAGNIIYKIKNKINLYKGADVNISIHLNAASKSKADGKVKGSEVLVYSTVERAAAVGNDILKELKAIGFTNRGIKKRTDLGILKGITNGGDNVLVEVFFCDDKDDYDLFLKVGVDAIGKAIAQGVLGKAIATSSMRAAKPVIKNGSSGTEAQKLQLNLNKVINAGLVADGKFGPKSVTALKKWQSAAGLVADGVYGPASYEAMQRLL